MRMQRNNRPDGVGGARRGGFTIIELLVSIAVIAVLVGLLVVVGHIALGQGYAVAGRQTAVSLKQAVEQFKQDHRFLPPMMIDEEVSGVTNRASYPVYNLPNGVLTPNRPVVATWRASTSVDPNDASKARERDYLRGFIGNTRITADDPAGPADRRFSEFSLGVYLAGLGEVAYGNANPKAVIDGVQGPGFTEPSEDGTWAAAADASRSRTGKKYGSLFDAQSGNYKVEDRDLVAGQISTARVVIKDKKGRAIRYYRWLRGEPGRTDENMKLPNGTYNVDWLNVPKIVGDPTENSELRSADFAIVLAGADGWFGDMPLEGATAQQREDMGRDLGVPGGTADQLLRKARQDNIVEVGR